MSSDHHVLRHIRPVPHSEGTVWISRLGLMAAYREEVLAPVHARIEPPPSGFDAVAADHPELLRRRVAIKARQLALPSLHSLSIDVLLAASRSAGRRDELSRCAGLFYALTGATVISKADFELLGDRFGRDHVAAALTAPGSGVVPILAAGTIESVGRYALRLVLTTIPALAGWEALQPAVAPDGPLDRVRLIDSVGQAARHLGLDLS